MICHNWGYRKKEDFMKKVLMLCALVLMLATTLFGCATTDSKQPDTTAPTTGSDPIGTHGHH